jgi:hypothetical protein
MLFTMLIQLIVPATQTFALTSGPSQPEVQSFEPVGTTDMVDMFSGDFVYNIPLMDVEGYPINISYHGGVDMEQEASWVGLGWNINPGVVNRTVRGLPDDMNGETVGKTLSIKDEKNLRVGLGAKYETFGEDFGLSAGADVSVNFSNYRGVSADIGLNCGVNIMGMASAGVNLGVGSQNGADVDVYAGLQFSTSKIIGGDVAGGLGFNFGTGYSTRTGLKDINLGISASVTTNGYGSYSKNFSATIPIGVKNIVPVITNSSKMNMYRGRLKIGGELYGGYVYGSAFGMVSKLHYNTNGSRPGYGYLYAENATDTSIMDFTRDKDGMFNETMKLLPLGNMTYDIYGVSGQGTGGSFRPFRNDFGSVGDPVVTSESSDFSMEIEAGIGNLFELGFNVSNGNTNMQSGPWDKFKHPFSHNFGGSLYQNSYFKQAGEITETNPGLLSAIQGLGPTDGAATVNVPFKKPNSENMRDPRGNLIYYFTADEAGLPGVASSQKIVSYGSSNGFQSGSDITKTEIGRTSNGRTASQISEIVQVQTDGRKYIYGIPAMNTSQEEVTMAVNGSDNNDGTVNYTNTEASTGNTSGRDNYFSQTTTPAFAHSYLLTSVLSTDYVDVKGDGPTDDDFGSFTKFNYTLKNASFGWKAPYGGNKAQFNTGFKSDNQDNKANYLKGTREQWMLHSVETKNFVAEFYTSSRLDARGVDKNTDQSYKLDSIKLYNKHDRFINKSNAIPIKTVIFRYDYSLCKGVPNNLNMLNGTSVDDAGNSAADTLVKGKLTLKKIFVRYGNSDRSMISPYQFEYATNKNYAVANKDRWGAYKPNEGMPNWEYPYVNQNDTHLDEYASAWSLNKITLPSGGTIGLQYEADDYAYVMDKPAMEMFKVAGVGNSPNFSSGNQLYQDKNNPNLYLYFTRRLSSEKAGLSFASNYLNGNLIYYNAETRLVNNSYEPIKGYAGVEDVQPCSDGVHGYIKLAPVSIVGGGASLNHISYTAINFGRYYLPHIIFPGSDPEASGILNIIAGIQYAFGELLSVAKNPVKRMTEEGKAKDIKLNTSYIRLNSPGMKKKGGGQRVKRIEFWDHWKDMAGGNTKDASYGKTYDYTTEDQGSYGTISSGVASYEPQIGGDENPFRTPLDYVVQSGGGFPPHDPVGLYQEYPVGESLYPGATVGYSRVTVKSIHQLEGRSSQGEDIYDFYTAKDFPIQVQSTPLNKLTDANDYGFFSQKRIFEASQGYTLTFNDMHGKPKRTEHRIIKPSAASPGQSELVSYKQYNYFTSGGHLSNDVPVVAYDPVSQKMKLQTKTVGLEADLTIDTREKKEETISSTFYINVNISLVGPFPIPFLPFPIPPLSTDFNMKNEFRSVVATKVVQQYGILKEVISSEEGALTTVKNEAFDPVTGQAVITSVNNEYKDQEFSVNYPAYWGYKSMGPSYQNTGYIENFHQVEVSNYAGELPTAGTYKNYQVGDELLITYAYGGHYYTNNVWVTGFKYDVAPLDKDCHPFLDSINTAPIEGEVQYSVKDTVVHYHTASTSEFPHPIIKPRYKYQPSAWPNETVSGNGTLTSVSIKVIRSGYKNQLSESMQSYTGLDRPFDGNNLMKNNLTRLINISAKEYSDTLTAILPKYDPVINPSTWDSLNEFVNGTRQVRRVAKEYAFLAPRIYDNPSARSSGLFSANTFWQNGTGNDEHLHDEWYCYEHVDCFAFNEDLRNNPLNLLVRANAVQCVIAHHHIYDGVNPNPNLNSYLVANLSVDPGWILARTVTKYSPWGMELENKDAIGNYTSAMYGYNQQLPVALAQNAKQHEVMFDGFEDYRLLQVVSNLVGFNFSPFSGYFDLATLTGNSQYKQYKVINNATYNLGDTAHTGKYSLHTSGSLTLSMPVTSGQPSGQARYATFSMETGKRYVISYWIRPNNASSIVNGYTLPSGMQWKSKIIEGWQQAESVITATGSNYNLVLPGSSFIDDIRIYPLDANMKSFVYHPVNLKLIATLDENNFATFYEYDQEGNLVRTKKETEKGVITVMESRSANVKYHN